MTNVDAILAEIKRLYYESSRETVHDDVARAIDLLKQLPDEATRERAAVYMEGLAEMRSEWGHPSTSRRRPGLQPRRGNR